MYEYGICPQADRNIFDKQCLALEKNINGLQKGSLEEVDVDGHKAVKFPESLRAFRI